MRKAVRAVIVDRNERVFLVQHRERNPADLGKWGNPGGGIDATDPSHLHALTRELTEEFGDKIAGQIRIGRKLRESLRPDRKDHFYCVMFEGENISPQAPDEIMNSGWFTFEEATNLKLFFGFEAELAIDAISAFK